MATEKKIIEEVAEKVTDFENKQTEWLADSEEASEVFRVKPPKRKSDNTFSNPRQTENFRATTAIGTLMYRMMTADDPFFNLNSTDLDADYDKLDTLTHVFKTQLKYARYRSNLLKACHFAPAFGTVFCQEDYRIIGVSVFGRQVPVTTMTPRSIDQVSFDTGSFGLNADEGCTWVATCDITSSADLMRLASEAKQLDAPWNPRALEAAAKTKEDPTKMNWRVAERLRRSGFNIDEALDKKKELCFYQGVLECMNDGIEYVVVLINRKTMVRFHPNRNQSGRRNLRIGKWVDFDGQTGLGLHTLLGGTHRTMDSNRQKETDLASMLGYNMWGAVENSVNTDDLEIGPLNVVPMQGKGDLFPIGPDPRSAAALASLDERIKQEYRAASHAADSLQAIVTDATATGTSLAQNESLRAISVHAEHLAEPLVREHLENMHANNVQNIRAPFNINKAGVIGGVRVYPSDLRMDLDIEAKTTTDKDFSPKVLERTLQMLQILTSTKSNHPDQMQISILPLVKRAAYQLQINPNELIYKTPMGVPQSAGMDAGAMLGMGGGTIPPEMMGAMGGGMGGIETLSTPVGPTTVSA